MKRQRGRIGVLAASVCLIVGVLVTSPAQADGIMLRPAFTGVSQSKSLASGGLNLVGDPFDIVLNFINSPTTAEQDAFDAAELEWETRVTGLVDSVSDVTLNIDVNLAPIDGAGGILGSAGPTSAKVGPEANYLYAAAGSMTFDTADTAALAAAGTLGDVILHEMAHVMGFGTLWSGSAIGLAGYQELYVNGSGQYTGAAGLAAFQTEFVGQGGATSVPVELGGGSGTANGHWNEGPTDDQGTSSPTGIVTVADGDDMQLMLMSGWLNSGSFISDTTMGQWEDLGYTIVPEPATLSLLVLGGVVLARRRRRA